ncbi:MAG: ATP phosphoribosyltransferase [Polyangiaceae bacterium]|nr:ATP phosphoribosyltransferase [Polyangiaceae bacterium]
MSAGGRDPLRIAVPKGRVLSGLARLFARAGIDCGDLLADDRRLVRDSGDGRLRFYLLKPDDVPTWVEYGAADLGVSGRDVLMERRYRLYQLVELGIGRCRLVVATRKGAVVPDAPRIATKYRELAAAHFGARGIQAEIVYVQGSVELAPLTGLADAIVDLVETGTTLVENDLEERETIAEISSVLVANPALYKLRLAEARGVVERLRAAVESAGEA